MRRREFIVGLASAWPVVARAQQPAMPVIGLLQIGAPSSWNFTGFRQGLKDTGYVEGQNLAIDIRWANNVASAFARRSRRDMLNLSLSGHDPSLP